MVIYLADFANTWPSFLLLIPLNSESVFSTIVICFRKLLEMPVIPEISDNRTGSLLKALLETSNASTRAYPAVYDIFRS